MDFELVATLKSTCPGCGESAQLFVAQGPIYSLCWSESIRCPKCNYTIEADDGGFPPAKYRNAILDQEGVWSIRVNDVESRIVVIKVLRYSLSLSLAEAREFMREVPGVVWSGTEREVDWLLSALIASGVGAKKESCPVRLPPSLYVPSDSRREVE